MLAAVMVLGSLFGAAHMAAPTARAECEGALVFSAMVPRAKAAVVGRVTAVSRHSNGFVGVLAVRVEHAYGIKTGAVYTARFKAAWCGDHVRVGSRVVLLIGIHDSDLMLDDGDYYFVVGQSATPAQAASVWAALPDTDAAAPVLSAPPPPASSTAPWLLLGAGSLGLALALRRLRRAGGPPRTPRPRTRAA